MRRTAGRWLARVLGLALVLTGGAAGAATPQERALEGLKAGDVDARRRAVVVLAEIGDHSTIPALVAALRDEDELVRALADRALWRVWSRSGDPDVDALLERGIAHLAARELDRAVAAFDQVIAKAPKFAEGWNKRATTYYLMEEYDKSLADCEVVIRLNPYHYGALSGFGLIYAALDQPEKAIAYFEKALRVNPNLEAVRQKIEQMRRRLREKQRHSA
jgi:tetratricopeptide (TPR) repeat protein